MKGNVGAAVEACDEVLESTACFEGATAGLDVGKRLDLGCNRKEGDSYKPVLVPAVVGKRYESRFLVRL